MTSLNQKREFVLGRELAFADAVGAAVFEKPKVSFWMVLLPILFVYFIFRMQKFRNSRKQFNEEFMITRRRAMEVALQAVEGGGEPDVAHTARESGLPEGLEKTYVAWVRALVDHYTDLLKAEGESFEDLVRSAYRNRTDYLLSLNRLNAVEKEFYGALKPHLARSTEGVAEIISTIQEQSTRLRRDLAEVIFP
ncbi:MAG: NF038143 family protein [Nitrospirota bacterium]